MPEIRRADILAQPDRHFGRLDDFSRLGLAGVALALRDAGLDAAEIAQDGSLLARDIGVVAATAWGCTRTDLAFWGTVNRQSGKSDNPRLFAYTLPSAFLGEAALRFGLGGPAYVLEGTQAAVGLSAVSEAIDLLVQEDCPIMLAGICDLPPPLDLCQPGPVASGTLFFVLELSPRARYPAYIWVELAQDGSVYAAGDRLADMYALAGSLTSRSVQA